MGCHDVKFTKWHYNYKEHKKQINISNPVRCDGKPFIFGVRRNNLSDLWR
jgi:hypothetical protein